MLAEIGQKADPAVETITLDGRAIKPPEEKIYVALHKPRYVLSTVDAEQGDSRQTVRDLVNVSERLYPVGRLDFESEGLILMTNDGELAQKLTHPSHHHSKEYRVLLARQPDTEQIATWQRGVVLEDGYKTQKAEIRIESLSGKGAWVRIIMREGRKRQIREIGAILGLPVVRIVRVRIGNLLLGELKPAEWRYLTPQEIKALKEDRPGLAPYPDMTRKSPVKPSIRPHARVERKKNLGRTAPPSGAAGISRRPRPTGGSGKPADRSFPSESADAPSRRPRPAAGTGRTQSRTRLTETDGGSDNYERPSREQAKPSYRPRPSEGSDSPARRSRPAGGAGRPQGRSRSGDTDRSSSGYDRPARDHSSSPDRSSTPDGSDSTPRRPRPSTGTGRPQGHSRSGETDRSSSSSERPGRDQARSSNRTPKPGGTDSSPRRNSPSGGTSKGPTRSGPPRSSERSSDDRKHTTAVRKPRIRKP